MSVRTAEVELGRTPFPVLLADVHLAHSSLSCGIGKHALAIEHANRELAVLGHGAAKPMQPGFCAIERARRWRSAASSAQQAVAIMPGVVDRNTADIHREAARLEGLRGDTKRSKSTPSASLSAGAGASCRSFRCRCSQRCEIR